MDYLQKPDPRWIVILTLIIVVLGMYTGAGVVWWCIWFVAGLIGGSIKVHGNRYTDDEIREIVRLELEKHALISREER